MKIILAYFNCSKEMAGKRYRENRKIQEEIEKYTQVEPNTNLICLGDFNGRVHALEPRIRSDPNSQMIEKWINNQGLHHLNQSEKCKGMYNLL